MLQSACARRHGKRGGASLRVHPIAAGLPRTSNLKVLQVLPQPRKTSLRCSKCCACHGKRRRRPKSSIRCRTPADLYEGAMKCYACQRKNESECCACHAKRGIVYEGAPRNESEVLQVLPLPRKTSRGCSKCCTCHEKRSIAQSRHSLTALPHDLYEGSSKCCACYAKQA